MKKILYIIAFGFLGLLISTIFHGVIELIALDVIFSNPANADSFWWQEWEQLHAIGAGALWVIGLLVGLFVGYTWYDRYGSKPGAFGLGK